MYWKSGHFRGVDIFADFALTELVWKFSYRKLSIEHHIITINLTKASAEKKLPHREQFNQQKRKNIHGQKYRLLQNTTIKSDLH